MSVQEKIQNVINDNKIIIFMKGTPDAPQCGFSAQTIECLKAVGAKFAAVNVLADEAVRQGIKEFSNWPTIPQVYVNGTFIGGCDIVTEMYNNGELKEVVEKAS